MKKRIICFGLICGAILIGCNSGKTYDEKKELQKFIDDTKDEAIPVITGDELKKNISESMGENFGNEVSAAYHKTEWIFPEGTVESPSGIVCRSEDVLITDRKKNCILRFDLEGNLLEETGQLGSGEMEFQSPMGITQRNEEIYILDWGNRRVQILDNQLHFQREFALENLRKTGDAALSSIAVGNDGTVYLAGNYTGTNEIYVYDSNGTKKNSRFKTFFGTVGSYGNHIYALNFGQIAVDIDKMQMSWGYGENSLFKLESDSEKIVCSLPKNMGINSFIIDDNKLIGISNYRRGIFVFDLQGNYIETVDHIDQIESQTYWDYIAISENGDIYVTRPAAKTIYAYKKEGM